MNLDIHELMRKALLGQLTPHEQQQFQHWLDSHPSGAKKYEQLLQRTDFALRYRNYAHVDVARAHKQFLQKSKLEQKRLAHRLVWRVAPWVALAAACWVAVLLWYTPAAPTVAVSREVAQAMQRVQQTGVSRARFAVQGLPPGTITTDSMLPSRLAQAQALWEAKGNTTPLQGTLSTQRDKEFWVTLADGTRVHMNYNTTLRYPVTFTGETREVELQGEAYFLVAPNSRKPFVVKTPHGIVTDYGTEFNINTRAPGNTLQVVLVSGKVGVTPPAMPEQLLKPGELAQTRGSAPLLVSKVDVTPYVAWNTGSFVFDNCTLADLMEVLARWYNKEVVFATDDIRNIRFTGSIDRYESIIPTMHAIHAITGLGVEVKNEKIIIKNQ